MQRKAQWRACAVSLAAGAFIVASEARAQFRVTTFKGSDNNEITNFNIADAVYDGTRPTRFTATGSVLQVDLFENGGEGQFLINNPFPGMDQNGGAGDTNDFTARATGTLVVTTPGAYDFFTDSDDGNRFRLDLNQDGTFELAESIVPDGGLQGAGTPERSGLVTLGAGNYNYEIGFFERGGGASIDAGYRVNGAGTQFVIGDAAGGIGTTGPASVRVVGAQTGGGATIIDFATADAVRGGTNLAFTATDTRNVINILDSGGDADFAGGTRAPGLPTGDNEDFVLVGTGSLVLSPTEAGTYTFRSNTDDGGRLLIDLNQDGDLTDPGDVVILQDVLQGPTNTDSSPISLAAGTYLLEYTFFERGGGAEAELSARLGTTGPFILVGDTGGLTVVPEPSSLALLGLGGLALLRRRRPWRP